MLTSNPLSELSANSSAWMGRNCSQQSNGIPHALDEKENQHSWSQAEKENTKEKLKEQIDPFKKEESQNKSFQGEQSHQTIQQEFDLESEIRRNFLKTKDNSILKKSKQLNDRFVQLREKESFQWKQQQQVQHLQMQIKDQEIQEQRNQLFQQQLNLDPDSSSLSLEQPILPTNELDNSVYSTLLQSHFSSFHSYTPSSTQTILNSFNPLNHLQNTFTSKMNASNNFHSKVSSQSSSSSFNSNLPNHVLKISNKPYKILEAPSLKNDFYLNLLDWSASNLVAVGLDNAVYVLSGSNQTVKSSFSIPDSIDPPHTDQNNFPIDPYNNVCSVGWSQRNDHIAVGDKQGKLYLFDSQTKKCLRQMHSHQARIGQIAWNGNLIASGSRDRNILITDVRDKNLNSIVFKGHKQEICGMRWSFDEQTLASGGNDNKVFLWSLKTGGKLAKISQSKAAVKAIGFSPHQHNIMAFGGGTADRCIRLYDTQLLKQIECIDTGSQVCNLIFSKNNKQIISTHGYSLNQIIVWNQQNMKKVATLTGHTQRVLYLAESPCGQNILTGAADETIRFWNIFKSKIVNELSPASLGLR